MKIFVKALALFLIMTLVAIGEKTFALEVTAEVNRYAGEAQLGSQPSIPIHIELRRSSDTVSGILAIPGSEFELIEASGGNTITGSFRGNAGNGSLTLRLDGDTLSGEFDLGGKPGKITALRTQLDAQAFFRPPEERLDLTAAEWLEDLERLTEVIANEHASPFSRISRDRFFAEVSRVRSAIPKLDGATVALEFAKLGALIGDGHTSVATPSGRKRLPIEFFWFEDGLRVIRISSVHREILGAKLISVNEVSTDEAAERIRVFVAQGETPWFYRERVPRLLNDPEVLRSLGISTGEKLAVVFETTSGASKLVELSSVAESHDQDMLGDSAPLWQRNAKSGFWTEQLADGTVYLNWRSYNDLASQSAKFLKRLDNERPRRLIIDLRDNTGGDYHAGRAFVQGIASRRWLNRRGMIYVIIGRKTFSAAMTNAIDFKLKTAAILVGEPAGAAPNNWQEVKRFYLPNSGLRVGVSTQYYEFLPGYKEVTPDIRKSPELSDWGSQQDSAVRLILTQPSP